MGIQVSTADTVPPFDNTASETNPLRRNFYKRNRHSILGQWQKRWGSSLLPWVDDLIAMKTLERSLRRDLVLLSTNEKTKFKLLYGQAFGEPTIFDQGALAALQSEDVKPTKVDTYEFGLNILLLESLFGNFTICKQYRQTLLSSREPENSPMGMKSSPPWGRNFSYSIVKVLLAVKCFLVPTRSKEGSEDFAGESHKGLGLWRN